MNNVRIELQMALVTRTMSNSFSDLAHFVILFMFVLIGYSIAGHLQFGEQHEGFSSFDNSMLSLFFSLIALDPPSFFTHTSGQSQWAFQIFFWSWLCLAFFILVRICFLSVCAPISLEPSPDTLMRKILFKYAACLNFHRQHHIEWLTVCAVEHIACHFG